MITCFLGSFSLSDIEFIGRGLKSYTVHIVKILSDVFMFCYMNVTIDMKILYFLYLQQYQDIYISLHWNSQMSKCNKRGYNQYLQYW